MYCLVRLVCTSHQLTGMQTARYQVVPLIRVKKRERRGKEEGEEKPGVVLLFPRAIHRLRVISSPAGDFFSPRGEKKRLPAWGEGTRWLACLRGEQEVRKPWWVPPCLSAVFAKVAKHNRRSRVVSLKVEP
ncbi:hypothetical protein BHM03_00013925 [Ensete ventricosum]|nr:hypothetical protein BHM03_00013925 [Ensete ventricosum]